MGARGLHCYLEGRAVYATFRGCIAPGRVDYSNVGRIDAHVGTYLRDTVSCGSDLLKLDFAQNRRTGCPELPINEILVSCALSDRLSLCDQRIDT